MSTFNLNKNHDDLQRILFPVLSSNISPLRPSINCASHRDTRQYEGLFLASCVQIRKQISHHHWPFCPIYLLHINTYCHLDSFAIPAEIALVETTFWPQLYGSKNDVQSMNISKKINEHYERHSHLYKRFSLITDDFHDFVHPGDQLPTGYQADILEHSRRTHGLPCTPYEKIGTQDYSQLLDDLNEMLGALSDSHEAMPMFCTMESFWSTKAALDWIYDQPSTRDRLDDYTLFPIEALIAVIYENFYHRAHFKCDLSVLIGKTPQQPILHSRACDYHGIIENKYCAMAHVRDLAKYYTSLIAYLFYTYCDQNSSAILPYIKVTYHGNLSLQQEAYWFGQKKSPSDYCVKTAPEPSNHHSKGKPHPPKKSNRNSSMKKNAYSNLNPLAVPFMLRLNEKKEVHSRTKEANKTPAQLVLYEPREFSTYERRSSQRIYQRLPLRPHEDWDCI